MAKENDRSLVGRCGLYCGACVIYRAERDDPNWQQRLADRFKCPAEKVRCQGCAALTPECWGYDCKFLVCLRERGFEHCFECPGHQAGTCEEFERFSHAYLKDDGVDLRQNLELLRTGRVEQWLKKRKDRYTCRFCGGPLVAGAKNCHHCNRELAGE